MHPTDMAIALDARKSRAVTRLMVEMVIALIAHRTSSLYSSVPGIVAAVLLQELTESGMATISQTPDRLTIFGITGAGDADTNLGLLQNWQAEAGRWVFRTTPIRGKAQ